eukprot:6177858-Pleurochrysis_carterae.AAC.2
MRQLVLWSRHAFRAFREPSRQLPPRLVREPSQRAVDLLLSVDLPQGVMSKRQRCLLRDRLGECFASQPGRRALAASIGPEPARRQIDLKRVETALQGHGAFPDSCLRHCRHMATAMVWIAHGSFTKCLRAASALKVQPLP